MNRGLRLLVISTALAALAAPAAAWYPSTPQVEFGTATW